MTTASRDRPKPNPALLAVVRPGLRPPPSRFHLSVASLCACGPGAAPQSRRRRGTGKGRRGVVPGVGVSEQTRPADASRDPATQARKDLRPQPPRPAAAPRLTLEYYSLSRGEAWTALKRRPFGNTSLSHPRSAPALLGVGNGGQRGDREARSGALGCSSSRCPHSGPLQVCGSVSSIAAAHSGENRRRRQQG